MRYFGQVNCALFLICVGLTLTSCQGVTQQNNTKIVGLQDPHIDANVKSALENGSVSEVFVRKDLLLFPVNAPNLVIAHRQEVHAVPQSNGTNTTDGKPTSAKVAEVNEYSLSQLVNDTNSNDETKSQNIATPGFSKDSQNDPVLEPGKFLEIASGFNLSNGLATEKVALPEKVQNFSLPKQSIVDLLSKSLAKSDASLTTTPTPAYGIFKRSIDSKESEQDDINSTIEEGTSSTTDDDLNTLDDSKRSIDSEEDDKDSSSEESSDTTTENSFSSTSNVKRSIDPQEYDLDSVDSTIMGSTSSTTEDNVGNWKRSIDPENESTSMKGADSTFSKDNGTENGVDVVKRSIHQQDDDMIGGISSSPEPNNNPLDSSTRNDSTVSSTGNIKRSIEPEELEMSNLYNNSMSTEANDSSSSTTDKIVKRSTESDEDDDSSSSNTEYYDDEE